MSTMIYLVLAVITLSGILYSVTSSMDSAKNNIKIMENTRKGDEIFSVLKSASTLNEDMKIIIPMPDKNSDENPIVPSWVYGDTQNSFGDDFIYCPFLSSDDDPLDLDTVQYKSKDNDYAVSGYNDELLAGREYAVTASKGLVVNGENVVFALATLNKSNKKPSCEDIYVQGKKLRIGGGKVWFFTDKSFSQKNNVYGGSVVLFVSSDSSQLINGNMSGSDKLNPTSLSSALSGILSGKYSDVRIKFYEGEYVIPRNFMKIGYDRNGYDLSGLKVVFEPIESVGVKFGNKPTHTHNVKINSSQEYDLLGFENADVFINDIETNFELKVSNGSVNLNNAEISGLITYNSKNSSVKNSVIGYYYSINSKISFSDEVIVKGGVSVSQTDIDISSNSDDYKGSFIVGADKEKTGNIIINGGSSITTKNMYLEVNMNDSDFAIKADDSNIGFYSSEFLIKKMGVVNNVILSNSDVYLYSNYWKLAASFVNNGLNVYGGGRLHINDSSLFFDGSVPKYGVLDNGLSFVSGNNVSIKSSDSTGLCWYGSIFNNSINGLSTPTKPTVDDDYYNHNKMVNKSSWSCVQ